MRVRVAEARAVVSDVVEGQWTWWSGQCIAQSARSRASGARSAGASEADGVECYLRGVPIAVSKTTNVKHFKSFPSHEECWCGVRSFGRLLTGRTLLERDRRMVDEPEEWRSDVQPLVVNEDCHTKPRSLRPHERERIRARVINHYEANEEVSQD